MKIIYNDFGMGKTVLRYERWIWRFRLVTYTFRWKWEFRYGKTGSNYFLDFGRFDISYSRDGRR